MTCSVDVVQSRPMNTTQINSGDKGDSSDGVAFSSDIAWLKKAEGGWQFGEAGVIYAIANVIGCNKNAVEFGGGGILEHLTIQRLVSNGWNAMLIEADDAHHQSLVESVKHLESVKVLKQVVRPSGDDSLASIIASNSFENPDVVVIDVDSDDYYFMASCDSIRPKIICVEHHDTVDPTIIKETPYVPSNEIIGTMVNGFNAQANVCAIEELANSMGYKRVWHSRVNSIFVLGDFYESLCNEPETIDSNFMFDAKGKKRDWSVSENPKVTLILSQPRLCFTDHSDRLINLAAKLKFNTFRSHGAFWDRDIECTTMSAIHMDDPDFLLYSDYDSVFDPNDVITMLDVIKADPTMAAIGAVQMSRHDDRPLVFESDKDYSKTTTNVEYHHFGLTLIRRKVFDELPHPWFWSTPGMKPDGTVGWDIPNRSDADITFWRLLRNANMKVVQHNEVVIGHMVLCVKWPKDTGYGVQLQPIEMYNRHGKPKTATINQEIYRLRMAEEAKRKQEQTNG